MLLLDVAIFFKRFHMVKKSSYIGTHTICFSLYGVENRKGNHLFF